MFILILSYGFLRTEFRTVKIISLTYVRKVCLLVVFITLKYRVPSSRDNTLNQVTRIYFSDSYMPSY
jgi:hypothetical protein